MKAIRKSLNKDSAHSAQISPPLPPISKPSTALVPPQKVIRASGAYRSTAPQELSFQKGDFFYVVREINNGAGEWYEAHNPVSGARGVVPRKLFEEFNKGAAPNGPGGHRASQSVASSVSSISSSLPAMRPPSSAGRSQTFFAIVMYDFNAERTDELDAKAGDAITVVAQSNREWFVAKPIGRLGKPGLIPVSFVQVRDPATNQPIAQDDVDKLMNSGSLPRVEEWKKMVMNYKASSIPLGSLEDPLGSPTGGVANSPFANLPPIVHAPPLSELGSGSNSGGSGSGTSSIPEEDTTQTLDPPARSASHATSDRNTAILPPGLLLNAEVRSFHFENEDYWFRVSALYQPYDPSNPTSTHNLPPARELTLFRVYNDFFDFQTRLIGVFPREAGREKPYPRVIPYMPGAAEIVDDGLTAQRQQELDGYLRRLARLAGTTARVVLESELAREFFTARPGDLDRGAGPQFERMSAAGWFSPDELPDVQYPTANGRPPSQAPEEDDVAYGEEEDTVPQERLRSMRLSDGSDYGEDARYQPSPANGDANGRLHTHSARTASASRTPSPRGHAPYQSQPAAYGHRPSSSQSQSRHRPQQSQSYNHANGNANGNGCPGGRDSAYSSASSGSRWPDSQSTHATSPTPSTYSPSAYVTSHSMPGHTYSRSQSASRPPAPPHSQSYSVSSSSYTNGFSNGHGNGSGLDRQLSTSTSLSTDTRYSQSARSVTSSVSRRTEGVRRDEAPPISATNANPAFIKIKIFDRAQDDLIALRVHPRVGLQELVGKAGQRLGGEVRGLSYKDVGSGGFVALNEDDELRAWIEKGDRFVLYAD